MKNKWNKMDWLVAKLKAFPPYKYCAASINRYAASQDAKEPKYLSGKNNEISKQTKRK